MMKLESLTYFCFGNNVVIGKHIRTQLDFLRSILPEDLRCREMDDLGCGDGKVTLLLKDVFQPEKLRGYDISQGLVRRAIGRGIDAGNINLDTHVPSGELAVVWGVLHHLKDPARALDKIRENYPLVFIREPVKTGFFKGLEMGRPLRLEAWTEMFNRHLPGCRIHYCNDSIMVFYGCKYALENEPAYVARRAPILAPQISLAGTRLS
jgi:SAM-dependent methyltransferase